MAPTAMPSSGGAVEPSAAPADGTSTAAFPLVDEGGLRTLLQASGAVGVACDIDETLSEPACIASDTARRSRGAWVFGWGRVRGTPT